jgi:3-oxoacyl-[acyl-carrier protein] reductase
MPISFSLKDKIALVVGGTGGIGAATAKQLSGADAKVAVTYLPEFEGSPSIDEFVATLTGGGHAAFSADVADTATLIALRNKIVKQYGRLDILVNAAGFTKPVPHSDLEALDDGLIDRIFQVNWRGQFATIRTFAPLLKASGDGLVVSISSISGSNGTGSSIAYCAVKAGIDVMTKSLARALAPQIRALGVAPGVVDTGFVPGRNADFNDKIAATTPLQRVASADDIAAAIVACATSLTFSTGTNLVVDGGRAL